MKEIYGICSIYMKNKYDFRTGVAGLQESGKNLGHTHTDPPLAKFSGGAAFLAVRILIVLG